MRSEYINNTNNRYAITELGEVVNMSTGRILKQGKDKDGYLVVGLSVNNKQKLYKVHRLLALAFINNPLNKKEINHINGIKDDNSLSNLEWVTRSENNQHAFRLGLNKGNKGISINQGETSGNSKLKEKDILFIRSSDLKGIELAKLFNVNTSTIARIKNRKAWKHI